MITFEVWVRDVLVELQHEVNCFISSTVERSVMDVSSQLLTQPPYIYFPVKITYQGLYFKTYPNILENKIGSQSVKGLISILGK